MLEVHIYGDIILSTLKVLHKIIHTLHISKYIYYVLMLKADLPSRTMTVELLLNNAKKLAEEMKKTMMHARRVHCTTDIWSNKLGIDSFLGVTGHFICSKDRKRHTYKLCMFSK